ncbi:hypothetical protein [uncultured Imperialibacter sp.]|uniref:hypothetical protein n=1 Tax=uncultured Imperialibacter sp. TaxID=1672639 RepID=UPI0030D7ED18|tara:strand:- start:11182 stop:11667 length:486 start_codon:yes stop_codon:yes gene_type:complete
MEISFWVPTVLALVSLGVTFRQNTRIKALERENAEYLVIRKLQFETEFSSYQKLLNAIANVSQLVYTVSNRGEINPELIDNNKMADRLEDLRFQIHTIFPFVNKEVTDKTSEFFRHLVDIMNYSVKEGFPKGYDPKRAFEQYTDQIERIETLIRDRILNRN